MNVVRPNAVTKCHSNECCKTEVNRPNVIKLNVDTPHVIMLNVKIPHGIVLNVINT